MIEKYVLAVEEHRNRLKMSEQPDVPAIHLAKTQTRDPATPPVPILRVHDFEESWGKVTNSGVLNQFHRYNTLHLLNLRFLEEELATVESQVLRAGLKFSGREKGPDQIIFEEAIISPDVCDSNGKVSQAYVEKLRNLIQKYGKSST